MLKNLKIIASISCLVSATNSFALTYEQLEHEVIEKERTTFYLGSKKVKVIALLSSDKKAFIKFSDNPSTKMHVEPKSLSITDKTLGMDFTSSSKLNRNFDENSQQPVDSPTSLPQSPKLTQNTPHDTAHSTTQTGLQNVSQSVPLSPLNQRISALEIKTEQLHKKLEQENKLGQPNLDSDKQPEISELNFTPKKFPEKFKGLIPVVLTKNGGVEYPLEYKEAQITCIESTCNAEYEDVGGSKVIAINKYDIIPEANEKDLLKSQFCIEQEVSYGNLPTITGRIKGIYGAYPNLKALVRTKLGDSNLVHLDNPSIAILSTPSTSVCNANLITHASEFTGTLSNLRPSFESSDFLGLDSLDSLVKTSNRMESGKNATNEVGQSSIKSKAAENLKSTAAN